MTVSAIILVAAIVLFIVSIIRTAKGKKKSIAGIICGSLLSLIAFIGIVYGAFGMLINAMVPAFEKDNPVQGDALYYLGDDGLMYRFIFSSTYQALWNVTVGTSEYMEIESKKIYQG